MFGSRSSGSRTRSPKESGSSMLYTNIIILSALILNPVAHLPASVSGYAGIEFDISPSQLHSSPVNLSC